LFDQYKFVKIIKYNTHEQFKFAACIFTAAMMLLFEGYALFYRWACIQQRWSNLANELAGWRGWLCAAAFCISVAAFFGLISYHVGMEPKVYMQKNLTFIIKINQNLILFLKYILLGYFCKKCFYSVFKLLHIQNSKRVLVNVLFVKPAYPCNWTVEYPELSGDDVLLLLDCQIFQKPLWPFLIIGGFVFNTKFMGKNI
jgi:hypothetical protein